jgi:hypothetical protein
MADTILKQIPSSQFLAQLSRRISVFMQRFRNLGLIETNLDHFLVIHEKKLTDYLAPIITAAGHHRGAHDDSFQTRAVIRQRLFAKRAERQIETKRR